MGRAKAAVEDLERELKGILQQLIGTDIESLGNRFAHGWHVSVWILELKITAAAGRLEAPAL
jgi:hypothetical protein